MCGQSFCSRSSPDSSHAADPMQGHLPDIIWRAVSSMRSSSSTPFSYSRNEMAVRILIYFSTGQICDAIQDTKRNLAIIALWRGYYVYSQGWQLLSQAQRWALLEIPTIGHIFSDKWWLRSGDIDHRDNSYVSIKLLCRITRPSERNFLAANAFSKDHLGLTRILNANTGV